MAGWSKRTEPNRSNSATRYTKGNWWVFSIDEIRILPWRKTKPNTKQSTTSQTSKRHSFAGTSKQCRALFKRTRHNQRARSFTNTENFSKPNPKAHKICFCLLNPTLTLCISFENEEISAGLCRWDFKLENWMQCSVIYRTQKALNDRPCILNSKPKHSRKNMRLCKLRYPFPL